MTMHCPADTRDLVNRDQISNFALHYRYFLDEDRGKFGLRTEEARQTPNFADPKKVFRGRQSVLSHLRNRQTDQLRYLVSSGQWLAPGNFYCATSQLDWRLVVGLGAEHVQETNMTLDHIYGIPYLPGSAFKGILRSWVIQKYFGNDEKLATRDIKDSDPAELEEKKKDFFTVFGSQKSTGKVRFLDVLPDRNVHFELDILNPHFPKYYTGSEFPTDDQEPKPIYFLTLKNTSFRFVMHAETEASIQLAQNWFRKAIEIRGFGAKSAVGYGYFRELNDKTEELKEEIAEKFSLDDAHDIYCNRQDLREFVRIDTEQLEDYAPKFAIIVTEEICEIAKIGGINEIPETLIETDVGIVLPSEFGNWVWEKTRDKLFEQCLEFPNLTYSSPFRNKFQRLSTHNRELLQEKLLEISNDFRRRLNRDLPPNDLISLQEKLLEIAGDLENESGELFRNLPQDIRTSLLEKLWEIADDLESETPLIIDPIIDANGQGMITVADGFTIQCRGIENGVLRLRDISL